MRALPAMLVAVLAACGSTHQVGDARTEADVPFDATANTWMVSIGDVEVESANDLLVDSACNLLVVGEAGESPSSTRQLVVKIDPSGNVQWQQSIDGSSFASSGVATSDGGYVIAGGTESSDGAPAVLLTKLRTDGEVAWQRTVGGPGSYGGYSIIETSDGDLVVAGLGRGLTDRQAWIVRISPPDDIEWQRAIQGADAQAIAKGRDGRLYAAGTWEETGRTPDMWVLALEPDGAVAWMKALGTDASEYASGLATTADGDLAVLGYLDEWRQAVVRLDPSGDVIWKTVLHTGDMMNASSLAATTDGGFFVTGDVSTMSGLGSIGGWLFKLDDAGDLLWGRLIDTNEIPSMPGVVENCGGGPVVAGNGSLVIGYSAVVVASLDGGGDIEGGCSFLFPYSFTAVDPDLSSRNLTPSVTDTEATVVSVTTDVTSLDLTSELHCPE